MEEILAISILTGIAFLALAYIPALMTKRAMVKIIGIFCKYNAVEVRNAKTINELGLRPPDFYQRLIRPRDYKPYALQALKQAGIVNMTDDGKLYIVEDKLDERWKCHRALPVQNGRRW